MERGRDTKVVFTIELKIEHGVYAEFFVLNKDMELKIFMIND